MIKRFFLFAAAILVAALGCAAPRAIAQEAKAPVKGLFLTKSSGYEHSVITRKDGQLGHADLEKVEHAILVQLGLVSA